MGKVSNNVLGMVSRRSIKFPLRPRADRVGTAYESDPPAEVGRVIAWRWNVAFPDGIFRARPRAAGGVGGVIDWPVREVARCVKDHRSPHRYCGCGIYGCTEVADLQVFLLQARNTSPGVSVVTRVELNDVIPAAEMLPPGYESPDGRLPLVGPPSTVRGHRMTLIGPVLLTNPVIAKKMRSAFNEISHRRIDYPSVAEPETRDPAT